MKALGIKYAAAAIKLALQNTAKRVGALDTLMQGHGMVQVLDCFEYLKDHHGDLICYSV
jgi:hypothetical protein